ncbi:hypothetical protein [Streptomyces sp. NRRL S-37]|uniref:hypothetical protein n=1 Tax=Streptomyces sp. NRRL S-37 TaxID=1463903 RepID=UPI0004CA434F
MRIPGIDALFHDPAAAQPADGRTVAAAEEEHLGRRGHGAHPPPLSSWEPPRRSARRCRERVGPDPAGPPATGPRAVRGGRASG